MRSAGALLGAFSFLWSGLLPVHAETRVALVIGNSSYQNVSRLENPGNDAKLLAEALRGLGFTLVGGGAQLDLDKPAFDRTVQTFGSLLQGADVGLFYYAGHGIQVRGANYLVPVDANPTREVDIDFQMLDTNLLLRQMGAAGTRVNIVILDACRNNPFGGRSLAVGRAKDPESTRLRDISSGLAQMQAPEGTLISFATQPGGVALDGSHGHSPYTNALAETIRRPGLDIFQTFNEVGLAVKISTAGAQQPWVSSSPISGSFYFATPPTAQLAGASTPTSGTTSPLAREAERAWAATKETTSVAVLDAFIRRYSDSFYADVARERIEALKKKEVATAAAPSVGRSASVEVSDCDRLAASPNDTTRPVGIVGVDFEQIDVSEALPACRAALAARPNDPRVAYQLSRPLGKIGSVDADLEAMRLLLKASDAGHAAAMNGLGNMYLSGRGVAKDGAEAVRWFRKAADVGNPDGMANLGGMYALGLGGLAKDASTALRWYRKSADAGDAAGMINLGTMYRDGLGVAKNAPEAVRWYLRAANSGSALAMASLGSMYGNGTGVAKNEAEAARWYRKAADAGSTLAMTYLGDMYRDGRSVAKDEEEAVRWYRRAVDANPFGLAGDTSIHALVMTRLGGMYRDGRGVAKDEEEAVRWYRKAADAGDKEATAALKKLGR